MKKLMYDYGEGNRKVHNDFVTNRTMKRESKGSNRVVIWCYDEEREKIISYVTTILLG